MRSVLSTLAVVLLLAHIAHAGTVITTNLPAGTAIVNINAKQDGAATWNSGQDSWFDPFFTGGATSLLQHTVQAGTYTFRLTTPTLAASEFPALTAGQLSQMFTSWTYNSPWVTDYFVFDAAGAASTTIPQIFAGAIRPVGLTGGTASPIDAFNFAVANDFEDGIVRQPGGRFTGVRVKQYTFAAPETLTFVIPDNILGDNNGGLSIVVSPATAGVPGDYNNNGVVDAADYVLWRNGGPLANDTTPGVQPSDYDVWRSNFDQTVGSGASLDATGSVGSAVVPEPANWLFGLMAILALASVRPVSNRTATLRNTWAKEAVKE